MTDNATEEALRQWGEAKRRINGRQPPPKSIMGRIATEGAGASIRGKAPPPPEVMLGTALEVGRAIRKAIDDGKLKERPYEALFLHYACKGPVKAKAGQLGVSRTIYYERLNVGKAVVKDYLGMD